MKIKKYNKTLPSGLGITKTGILQVPLVWGRTDNWIDKNGYGQQTAKIGDKIGAIAHGGRITLKNMGVLTSTEMVAGFKLGAEMENLQGEIVDAGWLDGAYVFTDEEFEDAIEYLEKGKK